MVRLPFDQSLSSTECRIIAHLTSPKKIQNFLDEIDYSIEETNRCPLYVLRDRMANCFDGAVFAAAMLSRLGYPPLILEMLSNGRDDDHVLALYKGQSKGGRFKNYVPGHEDIKKISRNQGFLHRPNL